MDLGDGRRQMARQLELPWENRGGPPKAARSDEPDPANQGDERSGKARLLEAVLDRQNMAVALKRVQRNRGGPGIDGMSTGELDPYLRIHWPVIRAALLNGSYRPSPVLRREIPKPRGGSRELGIPTVLDRLIQQALLQVLQPDLDRQFSDHSYGFRPGRSPHDAIRRAQGYAQAGRQVVVDVDLARFFDRVNHDVLMGRLARRVRDRRVLRLIRRYLDAGVMADGVKVGREEGTPQGGPLSPLLANVLLDEVDKELEARGHCFVRFADDLNVYVRTRRAGERVMNRLRRKLAELRLEVNEDKSAIGSIRRRQFLGYSFWSLRDGRIRLRVDRERLGRMKDRVREITKRTGGRSVASVVKELNAYLRGWRNYYGLAETPRIFARTDQWIRRRMRALQLHHWKRSRTAFRELRARGAPPDLAYAVSRYTTRWWWNASKRINHILTNRYFAQLGLICLRK